MIVYRDGREIRVCDGCYEPITEEPVARGWPKETTRKAAPWPLHFHSPECKKRYRKPTRPPKGAVRT